MLANHILNSFSYSMGPQPSCASYVVPISHPTLLTFIILRKKKEKKIILFSDRQFWSDRQYCLNERTFFNKWCGKVTLFANWNLEKYTFFFFFFLQLAKNIVNNMGQSLDALYFHTEVIVLKVFYKKNSLPIGGSPTKGSFPYCPIIN